jgi:hypothetical protein
MINIERGGLVVADPEKAADIITTRHTSSNAKTILVDKRVCY